MTVMTLLPMADAHSQGRTEAASLGERFTDVNPQSSWGQALRFTSVNLRFQATLDSLRAEAGFPGATVAFVLPDGTTRSFATGLADREAGLPMAPEARMLSGSTGKSFVAVALSLAQEGWLDLDMPISTWLCEEPWFACMPNAEAITFRMLLRHQGELVDHIDSTLHARRPAGLVLGGERGSGPMWDEPVYQHFNAFENVPRLEVPAYFINGTRDYNTPLVVTQAYVVALESPTGKELVIFEQSAHTPIMAEPEPFNRALLQVKERTWRLRATKEQEETGVP